MIWYAYISAVCVCRLWHFMVVVISFRIRGCDVFPQIKRIHTYTQSANQSQNQNRNLKQEKFTNSNFSNGSLIHFKYFAFTQTIAVNNILELWTFPAKPAKPAKEHVSASEHRTRSPPVCDLHLSLKSFQRSDIKYTTVYINRLSNNLYRCEFMGEKKTADIF